jgi:hypothetical protein
MADFSLTTLFVVPVAQSNTFASSGSTQDLAAGYVGFADNNYLLRTNVSSYNYWYVAQGRTNTYLQGSKRSDKIKGCPTANCNSNVTEWYMVHGCGTPTNQITEIGNWHVKCGDIVTVTLRAHSSYLDTLYFNGLTRSVTVQAPCCECGGDPCDDVDVPALIDAIIAKFELAGPGANPDNIMLSDFFTWERSGVGVDAILRIEGKALTAYGQPCDVAAFPHQYDRLWFRTFVYSGPETTADFIVSDACNIVADATVVRTSNYATGTSDEIKQLEKNYYSYQAGYLKHLYRLVGYNGNFESWVSDGTVYDTFYIKFNDFDKSAGNWGDYIPEDSMVIIAAPTGAAADAIKVILETGLGSVTQLNTCATPSELSSASSSVSPSVSAAQ